MGPWLLIQALVLCYLLLPAELEVVWAWPDMPVWHGGPPSHGTVQSAVYVVMHMQHALTLVYCSWPPTLPLQP